MGTSDTSAQEPSKPTPEPIQLSYGQHAPAWRRKRTIVSILVAAALLYGGYRLWAPINDWFELRAYRREAHRWYTASLTWTEPATTLKYTENPADAPNGKFDRSYGRSGATTYTGYKAFGGNIVDRLPLFTGDGKPILGGAPDEVMLFVHQRTTSAGLTRVLSVGGPKFNLNKLGLNVSQIGLLKGDYRILRGGSRDIDMTGICSPGEIRLFAGQPDPTNPARFSIPFQARGRDGFIDGEFAPGPSFSKDPASQKIEQEANSGVKFTIRMTPTTGPAITTAPAMEQPGE